MLKLYITQGSPYARMARIVVLEKRLEERVEILLAKTRAKDSPYYAINPSGRVPYLVREDGAGMEESAWMILRLVPLSWCTHGTKTLSDWKIGKKMSGGV
jgi:glutathione S-transferase